PADRRPGHADDRAVVGHRGRLRAGGQRGHDRRAADRHGGADLERPLARPWRRGRTGAGGGGGLAPAAQALFFRAATRALRRASWRSSTSLRYLPVQLFGLAATCSGVPTATISPPPSPPSGPKSSSQSAILMTSRLCSMTTMVLPFSTSSWSTSSSLRVSSKCRPVVGSSRMYRVLPVARLLSSLDSLTRWASPPDRVVACWPTWT